MAVGAWDNNGGSARKDIPGSCRVYKEVEKKKMIVKKMTVYWFIRTPVTRKRLSLGEFRSAETIQFSYIYAVLAKFE